MGDKPDPSPSERNYDASEDLLARAFRESGLRPQRREFGGSPFVPDLVLFQDKDGEQREQAVNYYSTLPVFAGLGDDRRYPRNAKAHTLLLRNIELHEDEQGKQTVDDKGRIKEVKLADASERAQLRSWLIFPLGYTGSENLLKAANRELSTRDAALLAGYHREGFRLAMKKEGFDIDGKPIAKQPLTPAEQLKLDCLTIKSLLTQKKIEGELSSVEQQALDQSLRRLNALASDDPDTFIKNLKEKGFDICKDQNDRNIFLIAFSAMLRDERGVGKPLVDSFEKLLETKYSAPLQGELHKDPQALFNWMKQNDPDNLKKWLETDDLSKVQGFPRGVDSAQLLANLRALHTDALKERWSTTMGAFPDAPDRGAFQDFIEIVLGKRDRFGAAAGLYQALHDVTLRENPRSPADTEKVLAKIDEAGKDPRGVASVARKPDDPPHVPIQLPPEAEPSWWEKTLGWACCAPLCCGLPTVVAGIYLTAKGITMYRDIRQGVRNVRDIFRWSRNSSPPAPSDAPPPPPSDAAPPVSDAKAQADVRRFWDKVNRAATALGDARDTVAGDRAQRADLLKDALAATQRDGEIHKEAKAHIDRLIDQAGTTTPPDEVMRVIRPQATAQAEAPSVIRVEAPLRLADVSNATVEAQAGKGAKIEITAAGKKYSLEDEKKAKETLDRMRDAYERRLRQLEGMDRDELAPKEKIELDHLKRTRATGWDSADMGARTRFLEGELSSGRLKFEYREGSNGRPGVGSFVIGASLLFVAVGAWLITDTPRRNGGPTRSNRN